MNRYSLEARFYPAVIILFPLLVLGVVFSIDIEKYYHIFSTMGIASVLSIFTSNITRQIGKEKEEKLWHEWGGPPSSQLLRLSDTKIDPATKKRYYSIMLRLVPESIEFFESDHLEHKEIAYKAWIKYLIMKTRDTRKYKLIFIENIHYGLRRNLWAMKTWAILIIFFAIGINTISLIKYSYNIVIDGLPFIISEVVLIILLSLWVFIINKNWIKTQAFSYAERLIEAIDTIET